MVVWEVKGLDDKKFVLCLVAMCLAFVGGVVIGVKYLMMLN